MKYFIGNWKMFGVPKSVNILNKINYFYTKDKNGKKYKVIITPPYTLIENFSKIFKNKKILIGAQNCFQKDRYSSDTGAVSSFMIKNVGAKYTLIGHSDNRAAGDNDKILKEKVKSALKNNLKIVFCIGENKLEKKKKKTLIILKKQITKVLDKKLDKNNIIIAYEPIWSIGTGKIPNPRELQRTIGYIKKLLKTIFGKKSPPVLYGGSVDANNVYVFKQNKEIDGFLIGGASKSSKKFIDIIKNYYR